MDRYIWGGVSFLLPFALYLYCLAPGVTFYDSGEFITAVHFLGSAHSPGYPLFILFAKPFTWLPIGSIAFRVNLATACSAALASLSLYWLTTLLLKGKELVADPAFSHFARNLAGFSAALLFAVSPRLWLQSNHDKPYPLLTFITAVILLYLLKWRERLKEGDEQPACWYGAAFLAGLASGAHQTIILLLPAVILFILMEQPVAYRRVREWLISFAMLLTGAAVQLYLPLRAAAGSRQNWGDPDNISRFLWHILRKGYPEEPHSRDIWLLLKQLAAFNPPREFGWAGFLLAIAGLWFALKYMRSFAAYYLCTLLCFWLVIAGYFNPSKEAIFLTEEFYTPLYLLTALLVTYGFYWLISTLAVRVRLPEKPGMAHYLLLIPLFLLIPATQLVINLPSNNQSNNFLAHDYAINSLRPLPENAVLFTWGDSGAFPLWYLQGVERMREDIELPHIPHLPFEWYRGELPQLAATLSRLPAGSNAEKRFMQLAAELEKGRPVLVDFSTRFSVNWSGEEPVQQGIGYWFNYRKREMPDETALWGEYVLHRMKPSGWQPDADSDKALQIHGYCLMQSAEELARRGYLQDADHLLKLSLSIVPQWQGGVQQMRNRFNIPLDEKR